MTETQDPYSWLSWLKERDAQVLLLWLMRTIEEPNATVDMVRAIIEGWRAHALRARHTENWHASVDGYLEVTVDARLAALTHTWQRTGPMVPCATHDAL